MKQFARALAIIAMTTLSWTGISGASAQPVDPFTVTDIKVDLTRGTSELARQEALRNAYVEGFRHLLERLALPEDRARLPRVDYATAADHATGLRIADEQTTATRYAATLAIGFQPDRVRQLLRQNGVGFAETAAPAVVVAPVYAWAGAVSLWEPNNPWRDAWFARGPAQGLTPVLLPTGDIADSGALSARQAAVRDRGRLNAFAARYGAAGVLVAEASYEIDPVSGRPKLDVTAEVIGGGPDIGRLKHTEVGAAGEEPQALGRRAADVLVAAMEASWKRQSGGIGAAGTESLLADLAVSGLADFANVRRRLDSSPGVARHELVLLSRARARFRIFYNGDVETVRAGMARQSLDLARAGGGDGTDAEWVLIAPPSLGGN